MKQTSTPEYNHLASMHGKGFMDARNGDSPNVIPALRIKEEKKKYKIEMTIPGFRKEDFNVFVSENMLTISCKKECETKNSQDDNLLNKRYTRFTRQLALPNNADSNQVKAKYNGTLKLVIAKKAGKKK